MATKKAAKKPTAKKIVKNETRVVCIAEFYALEGKTDELIASLHKLLRPTHKEPGCIRYELNQRQDDPRYITYIEKWTSQKAFGKHCATPCITHYFNEERPSLVQSFEVKLYREFLK